MASGHFATHDSADRSLVDAVLGGEVHLPSRAAPVSAADLGDLFSREHGGRVSLGTREHPTALTDEPVAHVVLMRAETPVQRVLAQAVVARVEHMKSVRYRAEGKFPADAVRSLRSPVHKDFAVAVGVSACGPRMAGVPPRRPVDLRFVTLREGSVDATRSCHHIRFYEGGVTVG